MIRHPGRHVWEPSFDNGSSICDHSSQRDHSGNTTISRWNMRAKVRLHELRSVVYPAANTNWRSLVHAGVFSSRAHSITLRANLLKESRGPSLNVNHRTSVAA